MSKPRYKVDCWSCGGSGDGEGCTCGEDYCQCLHPESPLCSECNGEGFLIVTQLTGDDYESAVLIEETT